METNMVNKAKKFEWFEELIELIKIYMKFEYFNRKSKTNRAFLKLINAIKAQKNAQFFRVILVF